MRLVDFFFALRPLVLVPAWSFFIVGFGLAHVDTAAPFPIERFTLLSLVLVAAYLINQVVDYESDRINDKGFFLQRGIFSRRLYVAVAVGCLGLALTAAIGRARAPGLLGASAALGLAYSVPPLRLVTRPGLDLLANGTGYGCLALLLGAGPAWSVSTLWMARLAAGFLAVAAVFLHTTVMDVDGDRRTGKRSIGVALGPERARSVAAWVGVGGAVSAWWSEATLLLVACATLAAVCVAAAALPQRLSSRTVCVAGTAMFALAAGVYEPLFLAAVAVLTLLTRLYYRKRFSLAYPAL
jgi:4-hydroxybenzoate polyprenyltransferase